MYLYLLKYVHYSEFKSGKGCRDGFASVINAYARVEMQFKLCTVKFFGVLPLFEGTVHLNHFSKIKSQKEVTKQ
jgi:hypothetical protein